jgi:hypothetical protein
MAILTTPSHKKAVNHVLSAADNIIPYPRTAEFLPLAACLSEMLSRCMDGKQNSAIRKGLLDRVGDLATVPTCLGLVKAYMKLFSTRIDKLQSPAEKERSLLQLANSWFDGKATDCYRFIDILYEWVYMIFHYVGVKPAIAFIVGRAAKSGIRYFAAIVAIHKFLARLKLQSFEQLGVVQADLTAAAKQLECRAHAAALELIATFEHTKTALDLATFERDCPESDALLDRLRNPVEEPIVLVPINDQFEPISDPGSSCDSFERLMLPDGSAGADTYDLCEAICPPPDDENFERIELDPEPEPFKADTPNLFADLSAQQPIRSEFIGKASPDRPARQSITAEEDWDVLLKF